MVLKIGNNEDSPQAHLKIPKSVHLWRQIEYRSLKGKEINFKIVALAQLKYLTPSH